MNASSASLRMTSIALQIQPRHSTADTPSPPHAQRFARLKTVQEVAEVVRELPTAAVRTHLNDRAERVRRGRRIRLVGRRPRIVVLVQIDAPSFPHVRIALAHLRRQAEPRDRRRRPRLVIFKRTRYACRRLR